MLDEEKKAYLLLLAKEKYLLAKLKKLYMEALEELKEDIEYYTHGDGVGAKIYQPRYRAALGGQINRALIRLQYNEYENINDYLRDSYTDGFVASMFSLHRQGVPLILPMDENQIIRALETDSPLSDGLYEALGVDVDRLRETISNEIARGIATNMPYGEIARNVAQQMNIGLNRARRIVLTEAHRIRESASQDARLAAKEQGARVLKQWDATLDGRTRRTHRKLDGQIREVDEMFEVDGKRAMQPGGFGLPEEDINCRCIALTRALLAMDEAELERLKKRAEFWELDKTEEFEEFRRKYLDAVK